MPTYSNFLNSLTANSTTDTVFLGNRLHIAPSTLANSATTGFVKVNEGVLATNDNLILISDATGTARIAKANADGLYITGAVTTQYYLEARKAWHVITSPLRDYDVTINQAWQEGNTFPDSLVAAEIPGLGTHITGGLSNYPDAVSAQDAGFDFSASAGANASIRIWEGGNWNNTIPDGTIAAAVKNYQAYLLYVRGDRKIDLNNINAPANATVLRATGPIGSGDQPDVAIDQSFTLLGNPFPSPIDFEKIYNSNAGLQNRFWKWDATLGTNGAYKLVQRNNANNYFAVPFNFNAIPVDVQHIPSGEGFFVAAAGAPVNVMVHETDKSDSINTNTYQVPLSATIFANLYKGGSADTLTDGIAGMFGSPFNRGIDGGDVDKPLNLQENFYLRRSGQSLMLEGHPLITGKDTLFLGLNQTTERSYKIMLASRNFVGTGLTAFLEDKFLNNKVPLSLDGNIITYSFDITSNPLSKAVDRFMITLDGIQALPLDFTNIKAYPQNSQVAVEWNVGNEVGINHFEVEKSVNGTRFNKAGVVFPILNGGRLGYRWLDASPVIGINYYRIRSVSMNGEARYSAVARVNMGSNGNAGITIYPNPVKGSVTTIVFNLSQGRYTAVIYNQAGQKVFTRLFNHTGGTVSQTLDLGNISAGTYLLQVTGPQGLITTTKLVKN